MSLAHDQTMLATSSGETTMITNLVQQTNTVLRGAPPGVVAAAFHPTQRTTLLILSPRGLYVFDVTKGSAPTRTIPIGKAEGGSGCITFSPCTPSLVAIAVPGGGGRVLMLDIEKEARYVVVLFRIRNPLTVPVPSLVKKFTVEESVTAMSFSHDGGSIVVGTEGGRILQLNLRSIDKPAQAVVVDPAGGRIGGLALIVASSLVCFKPIWSWAYHIYTICEECGKIHVKHSS
jgi:protein NEDD1